MTTHSSSGFVPPENTLIAQIQSKISITNYIGAYVKLKSSDIKPDQSNGCCPFHEDTHPSFGVNETKGVYSCKSGACNASGNVVTFRSKIENITYDEAKMAFARELGLVVDEELSPQLKILSYSAKKYHEALLSSSIAMNYLNSRGLTQETLKKFSIGFCYGNEFDRASAERTAYALEAGILVKSKNEGERPYSQMSGRVTFPIRNRDGMVIAFGGRRFDDKNGAKYLNTGETEYFKKSDILFGLYEARQGIQKAKHAIVVEGYMDTAILHQESIDNAVAIMGATANHKAFDSLWRVTKHIIFCLDPDKAGREGTMRSIMQAASTMTDECRIDIGTLPEKLDPDEYVLKYGAEQFKERMRKATPLSEWLCEHTLVQEEARNGPVDLRVAENRTRFLKVVEGVAAQFTSAPSLQLEIQRMGYAIINTYIIHSALKQQDIDASKDEIEAALNMMQNYQGKKELDNNISQQAGSHRNMAP